MSEGIIHFLDIVNININLSDTKIMISFIILLQILRKYFLFLNNYIPRKIMIDIGKETKFKSLKFISFKKKRS